jgi:hypothetical protein
VFAHGQRELGAIVERGALAPTFEAAAQRAVRSDSRPRSTVLVKSGATSRPTR